MSTGTPGLIRVLLLRIAPFASSGGPASPLGVTFPPPTSTIFPPLSSLPYESGVEEGSSFTPDTMDGALGKGFFFSIEDLRVEGSSTFKDDPFATTMSRRRICLTVGRTEVDRARQLRHIWGVEGRFIHQY
jgi:hypothetical protein